MRRSYSRKWAMEMKDDFAYHVTKFFAEYLPLHIGASSNTCKSYRDAFVQLLNFTESECGIASSRVSLDLITANIIEKFLLHLESSSGVSTSTRNQRLAAIHSFFRYLQRKDLTRFSQCSDIISIPFKKNPKPVMSYLSIEETEVFLSIPDVSSKKGLRDLAIIAVLYECAARVQELIDLTLSSLHILNGSPYIELRGKGNKLRRVPIAEDVSDILKKYLEAYCIAHPSDSLFFNSQMKKLTRAGVQHIVNKYIDFAKKIKPGFFQQKITNHSLRHSKAMHLLEAGVNLIYIRDFLGHSSVTTTEIYAKTNPEVKRRILTENNMLASSGVQYDASEKNDLLDWLKNSL